MNVYNLYSSSSEYCGFTTLGDPEMNVWTAIPKPLEVSHDSILLVGQDWISVSVRFENAPVESAVVCLVLDTLVYEYGYTTNEGEIGFHLDALVPGYMQITVTAKNKIPYIDSIPVISTQVEETQELKTTSSFNLNVSPNPFTHYTDIRYGITDSRQNCTFEIYDATGRPVADLSGKISVIGNQLSVRWSGKDSSGKQLPAGVYFVQVVTPEEKHTIPILLVR
jgi:hypothetical protein